MKTDRSVIRSQVEPRLETLRKEAHSYTLDDMKSGEWFERFVGYSLSQYAREVTAKALQQEYPDVPIESIVERRIVRAQQFADVEALATSSDYTWGLIATLGTDGGASPLTVQAGATAFAVDLMFTTQLQLQLAYDLSLLYGFEPQLDKDQDLWNLIKVAFGIRDGSAMAKSVSKVYPNLLGGLEEANDPNGPKPFSLALAIVGKKLSQRAMIKMGVPAIGIPLAIAVNHITTRYVGDHARDLYRDKAAIRDVGSKIAEAGVDRLLMHALWLVAHADGTMSEEKCWLIGDILGDSPQLLSEFEGHLQVSKTEVLAKVAQLEAQEKALLFDAVCKMAAVDHRIKKGEASLLDDLAQACDTTVNSGTLSELTHHLQSP